MDERHEEVIAVAVESATLACDLIAAIARMGQAAIRDEDGATGRLFDVRDDLRRALARVMP